MPMYDTTALLEAGVQVTGKIAKYGNTIDQFGNPVSFDKDIFGADYKSYFSIMRNQNMIETFERYMWTNIPFGLTADLVERLLYFRGKGMFYYNDGVGKFQFLPFALNGVIDEYGRYTACNTLPFTGVDTDEDGKEKEKKTEKKVQSLVYQDLNIVYDFPYSEELIKNLKEHKTVGIILNDSSLSISQQPIIRTNYVRPVIHMLTTLIQIINTAMYGNADHSLLGIEAESELDSANKAINAINYDILHGRRFTPIIGKFPITPIKTTSGSELESLFNTFNSLTNFLKSITGVANPGVLDKKAHLLQDEQQLNGSNADDIYYNGLRQRQEFCLMVQAYYNYPIWCQSKRGMSEAQSENTSMGETSDPDNTQYNDSKGGSENGNAGISK